LVGRGWDELLTTILFSETFVPSTLYKAHLKSSLIDQFLEWFFLLAQEQQSGVFTYRQ
jgi:hypothetical protein